MKNMNDNVSKIKQLSENFNFIIEPIHLNYNDSIENWNILETFFEKFDENYLLNITTIPRETIWTLFFFLKKQVKTIDYIYFKPIGYCKDWLTKNHKCPRLLFKHSGIFDINKGLSLFIIAGFDNARLEQIVEFYEPSKIVIFYQNGNQFDNRERNKDFEVYKNRYGFCELIDIDTYNVDEATEVILKKYNQYKDEYNIIIDSQGPKLSALSVYEVYLKSETKIGLAYVAAKDFNTNYSQGIDTNYIEGNFNLQ
jgi:hypothetical protein